MRVLVVYDVSDDYKRARLAKTLQRYGLARIQRSAFTGELQGARLRDLARSIRGLIDPETDVIHIVRVDEAEWRRAIVMGRPWGGGLHASAVLVY